MWSTRLPTTTPSRPSPACLSSIAFKAKTNIVNKRSVASGYVGLGNELFYLDSTLMVFGDAKKVIEETVKAVD